MKEFLTKLDQIAGTMNAWLFAIALGLAFLDFSVFIVKAVEALPQPPDTTVSATVNSSASH